MTNIQDWKEEFKELTTTDEEVGLYGMSLEESKDTLLQNTTKDNFKFIELAYKELKQQEEEQEQSYNNYLKGEFSEFRKELQQEIKEKFDLFFSDYKFPIHTSEKDIILKSVKHSQISNTIFFILKNKGTNRTLKKMVELSKTTTKKLFNMFSKEVALNVVIDCYIAYDLSKYK